MEPAEGPGVKARQQEKKPDAAAAPRGSARLFLVGDIGIHRDDPGSIFVPARKALEQADILIGNSEYPLTRRGSPWPGKREPIRRANPDVAQALKDAGFAAVSLANNHSMDYGAEGLLDTLQALDDCGIARAGAGACEREARAPALIERNGVRVALLSYTSVFFPGYSATSSRAGIATVRVDTQYRSTAWSADTPGVPLEAITVPDPGDVARVARDIEDAKRRSDIAIVSWHWGIPILMGHEGILQYQRVLGQAAIDAGADLVFGHHPHALQGIEVYGGRVICHSSSHFAFDEPVVHVEPDSLLLDCTIHQGRLTSIALRPVLFDQERNPLVVASAEGQETLRKLERLSAPLGTRFLVEGGRTCVDLNSA